MGDDETLRGARNRIANTRKAKPGADYYCGLEGGCGAVGSPVVPAPSEEGDKTAQPLACFAYIVVASDKGEGFARTGAFNLPPAVTALVRSGMELGHANDRVFRYGTATAGCGDGWRWRVRAAVESVAEKVEDVAESAVERADESRECG